MLFFRRVFFLLLFVPGFVKSQNNSFIFHHYTVKDGLSSNNVTCFLKDSRGVFWVGTFDGLNYFDGSHFYNFKKTKEAGSIINNAINQLCEDKEGNIWGGTENGIFCFDIRKNIFKNYQTPLSIIDSSSNNIARAVLNILCDSKGDIWATGLWTMIKFNNSKNLFEEIGHLSPRSDSLREYSFRRNGLIEDPSKSGLWLATRSEGLHFFDYRTSRFLSFKNQSNPVFQQRSVSALTVSASGNIWFFDNTFRQIVCIDPSTRKEIKKIDMGETVSHAFCATLFEDSKNRLWYGNWNSEMAIVEYKNGINVTSLKNEITNPLSVTGDFLWGVTEDKDGTIWLATNGGISKTNSSSSMYRMHWLEKKIPILKDNSITQLAEDPHDKSWWMTTYNKLYAIHYFPYSGKYTSYDLHNAVRNKNGFLPGPVNSLRIIDGKPVLCTWYGAWQIDTAKNLIYPFLPAPSVDPSFVIGDLVEHNGVYYFTNNKEVLKYASRENTLSRAKFSPVKFKDGQLPEIKKLCLASDNKLWFVAAFGWLGYLNEKNELVPVYIIQNEKELNGYFSSMVSGQNGKLWIAATGVGLYSFSPSLDSVKLWNETDGLVDNYLQTVIEDTNGRIWTVARNRFSVFTPGNHSFYNFIVPLRETNFEYENGLAQLSGGHIIASVNKNIVEFFPERLSLKPYLAKPIIGAVNIAGSQKLLNTSGKLELDPDEKYLSFKFGLMTDKETFHYQLEYRMKGFDNKWIVAGDDNQAVYNNLPPGNYTFQLKAKAKNGEWESPETTLKVHINTPFYRSAWFITLAVLIICLVLFFFYRFRIRKQKQLYYLENKAQLLEKEKALVMYEGLKQQLNPHFLFNSLTSLNSLIAADPKTASEFLDSLSKTYRYILKSRDSETVTLADELKSAENYIKLQHARFGNGFGVQFNVPEEYQHRKIVPVTLQNLVENAIKHNIIDEDSPLVLNIFVQDDCIVVQNNLQRKNYVETSNKQGLANLQSLYHYLCDKPVEIITDKKFFTIKIPLI